LDEVDDTSILKTKHPATLSMISTLVNVLAEPPEGRKRQEHLDEEVRLGLIEPSFASVF
jgi:hypothetical protein